MDVKIDFEDVEVISKKWRENEIFRLLHLYEENELLWNPTNSYYKNKMKRIRAMRTIISELNIPDFTIDDFKRKIKSIRSTYNQELTKVLKAKRLGQSPYKPQLVWFMKADNFLRHITINRNNFKANYWDVKNEPSSPLELNEEDVDPLSLVPESPPPPKKTRIAPTTSSRQNTPTSTTFSSAIAIKQVPQCPINTSEDIFEAIGKNVAHKLRSMAQQQRIIAEKIVGDVMYHGQMESLTVDSHLVLYKNNSD